jgi:hypothetical protein
MAAPALARNYCDTHRCYHRGPVGAAADTAGNAVGAAAGVAGAAIGTAGAIATSPFRDSRDSYAYDRGPRDRDYRYRQNYQPSNGFACQPGTWFKGEDGRRHLCQ